MTSYRHPDPAVHREMDRIRRARSAYGYDSHRREQTRQAAPFIDWPALRRRAVEIVILYVLIADLGLILIAVRGQQPLRMSFPADVTSSASPHPATGGGHP